MSVRASWHSLIGWEILALALAGCAGAGVGVGNDSTSVPTSSPTPPEPSIGADGRALPGFVTAADDLPSAARLPQGTLEASDQGWALGIYRPSVERIDPDDPTDATSATSTSSTADAPDQTHDASYQVVYLATPGGERFQVLELAPEPALRLIDWVAGDTSALVFECAEDTCLQGTQGTLDLLTGEITPIEGFPDRLTGPAARVGDFSLWIQADEVPSFPPSGHNWVLRGETWTPLEDGAAYSPAGPNHGVSPDGSHLALMELRLGELSALYFIPAVLSVDNLEIVRPPLTDDSVDCRHTRWLDAETLVMDCRRGPGLVAWHIDLNTLQPFDDQSFVYGSRTPNVTPIAVFADGSFVGSLNDGTSRRHAAFFDGRTVTELVATDDDGEALAQEWILASSGSTVALGATRSDENVTVTSMHLWNRGSDAPVVAFPEVNRWPKPQLDRNMFRVESLISFTLARQR